MDKNISKNRLLGSLSGPSDVLYRNNIRNFFKDVEFINPFAITLTMSSTFWRSASQNFRHFMNRLNQTFLKSSYRRYGNRLSVIPILEGTKHIQSHYHCVIDNPYPDRNRQFINAVKTSWNETTLGRRQIDIQPMTDDGWIDYMTKLTSKSDIKDSVDWENINLPRGG